MSKESKDNSFLSKFFPKKLKEFYITTYEPSPISTLITENQGTQNHGRERFNLEAAIFYGKRMIPLTIAMWIIAYAPIINPNFVNSLHEAIALGVGSGLALSIIFGLEKRRFL